MEAPLETLLQAPAPADLTYRPRIFTLPVDEAALRELLSMGTEVRITNRIEAQLRELLKALNPSIKFTEESLKEAIDNHLGGSDLMYYGSWVHYPWSNHLVHLLGAEEFALVRTDRNRNKITREEQAELATKKIGVIGLSVGQSVSLTMAMERSFGEIRLADFDTLDLSNLNRIRTGVRHLGMNKAVITAREIAEIDPYLNVVCFTDGLTQANMEAFFTGGGKLDILVEECDSVDIKILARQQAKALRIPVVMDMSDRGCLDVERFDLEPDRPIMHGWIDHLDLEAAKRPMSAEEKVPYMLPITGVETLSPRMKASVIELGQTICTWPQLGTAVALGGALAGDAVRRIALGQFSTSGRWFVDLEEQISDPHSPEEIKIAPPEPFRLTREDLAKIDRQLGAAPANSLKLDHATLHQLVEAGGMAPSNGNMQPWQFMWHGGRLLLFHDKARSRSVWDPDHRMAHIALGACVENVVLKAHALGLEVKLVEFAEPRLEGLFAAFEFHAAAVECAEPHDTDQLASYIPARHTDRSIGTSGTLSAQTIEQLNQAASNGGCTSLLWIRKPELLQKLASLHGAAERLRLMHPQGHAEYFKGQLRWSGREAEEHGDGLELASFGLPPMAEAATKVMADPKAMELIRTVNGGRAMALLPAASINTSAAMVLFTATATSPADFLRAGRAVQRFWLAATGANWGIQPAPAILSVINSARQHPGYFNASMLKQVSELEQVFQTLLKPEGTPVFLLRVLALGRSSKRAVRRPPHQLLIAPEISVAQ